MTRDQSQPEGSRLLPRDLEQLYAVLEGFFVGSARPDQRLLGLEFECLRVCRRTNVAAPSLDASGDAGQPDDGPGALIERLAADFLHAEHPGAEIRELREGGLLSVINGGPANLSLEPGGQIELSLPPFPSPVIAQRYLKRYLAAVDRQTSSTPYTVLFLGHQPCTMPDDIPLRAKPRYAIMDRRLRQSGTLGPHMMRATAGMQVTVDFSDARECASLLRAVLTMAPFVAALFANSPLVGGKDSGYQSFREKVWWNTDPSRCGIPLQLLSESASLRGYVDFALDAEVWFHNVDGQLREIEPRMSFRELVASGEPVTLADFQLHASTLFPMARIRGGVEIRSADCVPPDLVGAFLALQAGCLYDAKAREEACDLHHYRQAQQVRELHDSAARHGIEGRLQDGFSVGEACHRMVKIAGAGIERQIASGRLEAACRELLPPLRDCLDSLKAPAVAARETNCFSCEA